MGQRSPHRRGRDGQTAALASRPAPGYDIIARQRHHENTHGWAGGDVPCPTLLPTLIGSYKPAHVTNQSIGPAHELRQLGAGVDTQLGERIVDVVFHRMEGKVQLRGDVAVGDALPRSG